MGSMQLRIMVLLLAISGSLSFDFCHSDPRLKVLESKSSPTSSPSCPSAIYLPVLDKNPNHALHDRLWALSHYLHHCAGTRSTVVLNDHFFYNLSLCKAEDDVPNPTRPSWGICVAFILSQWHDSLLHFSQSHTWPDKTFKAPGSCYSRHVWIGVQPSLTDAIGLGINVSHFRRLSWFGRNCEEQKPCLSGMSSLPESLYISALNNIVSAVRDFFKIGFVAHEAVNVLLYDRNDTFRRKWRGAKAIYDKLRHDKRINVQLIHRMPVSFSQQVKLFAWADIVLAPHGGAMANTIFMQSGGDILEVRKNCEADARLANFMPWDWTGWHAHLLGINIVYIDCTADTRMMKTTNILQEFTVNITEVLRVIEGCVRRQIHRRHAAKISQPLSAESSEDEAEDMLDLVSKEFLRITRFEFLLLVLITSVITLGSRLFSRRRHITRTA